MWRGNFYQIVVTSETQVTVTGNIELTKQSAYTLDQVDDDDLNNVDDKLSTLMSLLPQ